MTLALYIINIIICILGLSFGILGVLLICQIDKLYGLVDLEEDDLDILE